MTEKRFSGEASKPYWRALRRLRGAADYKLLYDAGLGAQALEARVANLRNALRDCMDYVDADNLTMQTKHRNWQAVLDGGPWNRANVEVSP